MCIRDRVLGRYELHRGSWQSSADKQFLVHSENGCPCCPFIALLTLICSGLRRFCPSLNALLTSLPTGGHITFDPLKTDCRTPVTDVFISVCRLCSRESKNLMSWFADTLAPDEYIWPTLNHNPQLHAPGSYKGKITNTVYY